MPDLHSSTLAAAPCPSGTMGSGKKLKKKTEKCAKNSQQQEGDTVKNSISRSLPSHIHHGKHRRATCLAWLGYVLVLTVAAATLAL